MKTRFGPWLILFGFAWILSSPAFGQLGFEQDERQLVQKYKASIAKLQEGKALFLKAKYDRAEKKLQEALKIFPRNPDAHYLLAQIALNDGDHEAALSSIEDAEASFVETRKFYAYYYEQRIIELREQKTKLEESIRSKENQISELRGKGRSQSADSAIAGIEHQLQPERTLMGKIDQQLRDPIPENPPIPAGYHYIHGNILYKLKRPREAVDQYLETIRIDPHHEFAYNNLAGIYFGIGQYQTALDYLLQAEANGVKINETFKKDLETRLGKK
ncbi:MAG: tetratricopeptide repeat protein [Candidatus Aminicenantes bacterium]|nr:tetratricopeptide repeat protein [Candidatus Aminicenantes bacterium]